MVFMHVWDTVKAPAVCLAVALAAGCVAPLLFFGCPGPPDPPIQQTPPYDSNNEIARLRVEPPVVSLSVNQEQELSALIEYTTGDTIDVSDEVQWLVQDEDVASIDGDTLTGEDVGQTSFYAVLDTVVSNAVVVDVADFTFSIEPKQATQGEIRQFTFVITSGSTTFTTPDTVDVTMDGCLPFGEDRSGEIEPYFVVEDDTEFSAYFIIPPTVSVGEHGISLTIGNSVGHSDDQVTVNSAGLAVDVCNDVTQFGTLGSDANTRFQVRRYLVNLDNHPRGYRFDALAAGDYSLDPALWLFDEEGNLFIFVDDLPSVGGNDALIPFGTTDTLHGNYAVMMAPSPYAETTAAESGYFEFTCSEEQVQGDEYFGETDVAVANQGATTDLEIVVDDLDAGSTVIQAWVHVDLDSDAPTQVTLVLEAPTSSDSVALRSTANEPQRLAITWGQLVEPDIGTMDVFDLTTQARGNWILHVTDVSSSGTTVIKDWRLYLDPQPP